MQWKYVKVIVIKIFVFPVGAFQFSKFHQNEVKYDKSNFKRDLSVSFKAKKSSSKEIKYDLLISKKDKTPNLL